ncbi:unnamed protein product [Bursaphelenchus okinawaensis]|uniref:Uncharacterized protein n=1 Tax=Bursaphelenchus okinawaensis TaxID=465554 RepID=A0A811K7S4_9BILA|nr:unnamed protein product [Bursaphelenchus okinawaensis]CAG9093480.1 unnamed protein product [Bursaphelenchus okinawaensis]
MLQRKKISSIADYPDAMTSYKATDLHLALQSPSSLLDSPPASVANGCRVQIKNEITESSSEFLGSLEVSLPSGKVVQMPAESSTLSEYIQVDGNLLTSLHGKGGQILTMQAFCGGAKPRMFARLKNNTSTLPCSFNCEFKRDLQNPANRLCSINVYAVQFVKTPQSGVKSEFITRHNSSCSFIYFDAASVPYLGHFPSEKTGSSLFSIVHSEDVAVLERVHRSLKAGVSLERSSRLRLIGFDGRICTVDTEWAAFTNPWTGVVEMVVAKHTVIGIDDSKQVKPLSAEDRRRCDVTIRSILESNDEFVTKPEPTPTSGVETPPLTKNSGSPPGSPDLALSYTQINCLENVHRLLKSQTSKDTQMTNACPSPASLDQRGPLTRELLNQHDRRWEALCKGNWHRRLQMKRSMGSTGSSEPRKKPRVANTPSPLLANALGHQKQAMPTPQLVNYINALLANPQMNNITTIQTLLGQAIPTQTPY